MRAWRGGMEFQPGRPLPVPPPPPTLQAQPVRVHCAQRPEVQVGQVVRAGQILFEPSRFGRGFRISPMAGVVRLVSPRGPIDPDKQEPRDGYDIAIEPQDEVVETSLPVPPPRGRRLESWFGALRQIGGWSDRDGELGLIPQLEAAQRQKPEVVLCVGLDAYPPYPDRSSLLMSFPDDAALGTIVLADLVGASRAQVITPREGGVSAQLRTSCRNYDLPLAGVPNPYPAADPTLVVWSHLPGCPRLPHGASPITCGVLIVHPWTAIRIGRWFTLGRFDLVRPLFIGWPEPRAPMTFTYAMAGQSLATVDARLASSLETCPQNLVAGNPLTGRLAQTTPTEGDEPSLRAAVPNDVSLVCVLPSGPPPRPQLCIHCGWCAQVCPTRLRPIDLVNLARRDPGHLELARQLPWCVDCGLCSHVCPSEIPLAQLLRQAALELGLVRLASTAVPA